MIATLVCVAALWCAPVVNTSGNQKDGVTTVYPGLTQQVQQGYGTILSAHIGLTGSWFYYVYPGDIIYVWYGDERRTFQVTAVKEYQMIGPLMKDLRTDKLYTVRQVYNMDAKYLQLQTCIESQDRTNPNWGRLLIVAVPVSKYDRWKIQ